MITWWTFLNFLMKKEDEKLTALLTPNLCTVNVVLFLVGHQCVLMQVSLWCALVCHAYESAIWIWSIQLTDFTDKNFSYQFCHVRILPIFIIKGPVFVWILWAPSKNEDGYIWFEHIFCSQNFTGLQLIPPPFS